VPLASIDRARTVFVWGGAEKPGKPAAKKPGKGSKDTGGAKPPKGPSDELDAPIRRGGDHMSEEANA
jgi:hypothetical protein